jgi:hypothetical protein
MGEARDTQFWEGRKDITMLEDSRDLPARPSEGSSIKINMLVFVRMCDFE